MKTFPRKLRLIDIVPLSGDLYNFTNSTTWTYTPQVGNFNLILFRVQPWWELAGANLVYRYSAVFGGGEDIIGGTIWCRLYDWTDGVPVPGSELQTTMPAYPRFTREVTNEIILVDGHEYRRQFRVSGGTGYIRHHKILVLAGSSRP